MTNVCLYKHTIINTNLCRLTSMNEKRIWTKKWVMRRNTLGASNALIKELAIEDPKNYFNFLRIDETMFNILLAKVGHRLKKQNTMMRMSLTPQIKLRIALQFLATGDSYKSLQ